jgi:hypothetical protein
VKVIALLYVDQHHDSHVGTIDKESAALKLRGIISGKYQVFWGNNLMNEAALKILRNSQLRLEFLCSPSGEKNLGEVLMRYYV